MKQALFGYWPSVPSSFGLLVLRFVAGPGLMLHGWPKIQNPFGWMGPDSWAPGFLQAIGAITEVVGGLALLVGFMTPLASLLVAGMMAVAAVAVHMAAGDPFVARGGGRSWELAALYFAIAVTLLSNGPGRISLDYILFGKARRPIEEPRL